MATRSAHPGFQALVKSGVPAGALANAARRASPAAKRKNPRLNKVSGVNRKPANVGSKKPMKSGGSKIAGTKGGGYGKRSR